MNLGGRVRRIVQVTSAAAALDIDRPRAPKLWRPKRVLITPAAFDWEHGRRIVERVSALGIEVTELKANRLTGLSDPDPRREYIDAKNTLAIINAPQSKLKLQPIAPSADWRVDLAEGCPAHCQYCYLAGSLQGPPVTRVYANLPEIFGVLPGYLGKGAITSRMEHRAHEGTTFEASCYTDPLGIEHLTGSLSAAITEFGRWDEPVQLRFTTKYDNVAPLLELEHRGRTRVRFSVNAAPAASRFEGGTASVPARLAAMRRMAQAGYPVGLTIAPIMPIPDWREHYAALIDGAAEALSGMDQPDLTVELITHRFTPGSKSVLTGWYPGSSLEMDEEQRSRKTTKFGSLKYVYPKETMGELRSFVEAELRAKLPQARVLYWT